MTRQAYSYRKELDTVIRRLAMAGLAGCALLPAFILAPSPAYLADGAEHDDVAGAPAVGPEWEVERDLVIGSVDDPATALHQVADIALDQERRILVLEAGAARVRTYYRDGTLAEELGGRGEGPGEFTRPTRLGWRGDTLWVGDGPRHRLTLFLDGEAPVTISFTTSVPGSAVFGALLPAYLLGDGSVLATPSVSMRMLAQDQEELDSIPRIRTDREGTIVDTLFWSRRAGSVVRVDDALGLGSVLYLPTPFSELSATEPVQEVAPPSDLLRERPDDQDEKDEGEEEKYVPFLRISRGGAMSGARQSPSGPSRTQATAQSLQPSRFQ